MVEKKWGTGKVRPEQGILKLRKELQTFGNLRPCFFASESLVDASPLKASVCQGTNFTILRELTGGIYFGDRKEDDGDGTAYDIEPYNREEITRITRLAAHLALAEDPPLPVWSLDKANVLATSRLWRKVVTEVMEKEFPQLKLGHHLIDSAAMLMVKNPRALNGIVVTSNLFGDIISDEASVIPGSLGLLPSASLGGIPEPGKRVNGIYEPIHGTQPLFFLFLCSFSLIALCFFPSSFFLFNFLFLILALFCLFFAFFCLFLSFLPFPSFPPFSLLLFVVFFE